MNEASPTRYVVIDVETPNHQNNRISSIGYAVFEGDEVLESGGYLVNPEVEFDAFNINLTGITPDSVKDAPTFPQVWEQLKPMLDGAVFVAHNAKFDLAVLNKTARAYGIEMAPIDYLCTYELSQQCLPEAPGYKLNVLCDYLQIPLDHHRADSDAFACAAILYFLISNKVPVDHWTCTYDYAEILKHKAPRRPKLNSQSEEINELLNLLEAVSADGILTEQEALIISGWCHGHIDLSGHYPYDRIISALQTALEDGVLDAQELDELLILFRELADPVGSAPDCADDIVLNGKQVCLSGDFDHGSKSEIASMLESRGAVVRANVVKKLDYLIVGGQGSTAWASGNYGTKVKKALELQSAGAAVQIIREADLFAALEANV